MDEVQNEPSNVLWKDVKGESWLIASLGVIVAILGEAKVRER